MPRTARIAPGGMVFHVVNRANGRGPIFASERDYVGFELVLARTVQNHEMRLLAYCVMPNHWHLVVWPEKDGDLARFMHSLTTRHVRRWHRSHNTDGTGHLYQGPYRSFPVQSDRHLLSVCRYVERNALSAGLVDRAEDWRWSSADRLVRSQSGRPCPTTFDWPVPRPNNWLELLNTALTAAELAGIRRSVERGVPFGNARWREQTADLLCLTSKLHQRGRPRGRVRSASPQDRTGKVRCLPSARPRGKTRT